MWKFLRNALLILVILIAGAFLFAPKESTDTTVRFDPSVLGQDLDAYLTKQEARFDDITNGAEKRIVWAGEAGEQTDLAIVYVHGYSATSEEIRPVPDNVAMSNGANLYFTRLAGHGRPGDAMSEPNMNDWVQDMAETMEIGRRIGKKVVVISTSTGATLAILAASDPEVSKNLAGLVLVSANFAPADPAAQLAYLPFARSWIPALAGEWYEWEPFNDQQREFWTWRYKSTAIFPMMSLLKVVNGLDLSTIKTPSLWIYSDNDQVIQPALIAEAAEAWGGPKQIEKRVVGPNDSPSSHVIAGDILSPSQTGETVEIINAWIAGL